MQQSNHGRLIDFASALGKITTTDTAALAAQRQGISLGNPAGTGPILMEPRTIRHQERVEDLFYLLFRRTGS